MESCGPCKVRAADTRAVKYCVTCQEPQCEVCCDVHSSSKATRSHLLIDITDFNKDSRIDLDLVSFQKCPEHEKDTDFFCTDHNHLLCSTCLLNSNKLGCKSVVDISSVGESLVNCKFGDKVEIDLNNIILQCIKDKKEIQNLVRAGKNEQEHLRKTFHDIKHGIVSLLDKYEKQILDEVDNNFETEFTELKQQLDSLNGTLNIAKDNKSKLQTVTETGSKADVFRCILSITDQLESLRLADNDDVAYVYKHSLKLSTTVSFLLKDTYPAVQCTTTRSVKQTPQYQCIEISKDKLSKAAEDVALRSFMSPSSDYLYSSADAEDEIHEEKVGEISTDMVTHDDQHQLHEEIASSTRVSFNQSETNVVNVSNIRILTPDENQLAIESVTTLTDGRLIVSDKNGSRLIALNENFTYNHELELAEAPGQLTEPTPDSIAMCLPTSNRIAIISVKTEMEWTRTFKTQHSPRGIYAIDKNRLFVSMTDENMAWCFNVLTPKGAVIVTIRNTPLVIDAAYISSIKLEGKYRHYLLCCNQKGFLYSFQADGVEIFQYKVKSPTGVYVDDTGLIYVVESVGTLHILTSYGELLQKVLIPEGANGITCHKKMNCLVITRKNQSELNVFKVKR